MDVSIIFPCLGEAKVSAVNSDLANFVEVQSLKTLNELRIFLTKFSYNLFTKTFLLLRISLLKRFIYRRVNTSKILRGATIPITLTKNQVKTISVNFIKKKLPSSKAIYGLPTRKIKSQEKSCIQSISHVC